MGSGASARREPAAVRFIGWWVSVGQLKHERTIMEVRPNGLVRISTSTATISAYMTGWSQVSKACARLEEDCSFVLEGYSKEGTKVSLFIDCLENSTSFDMGIETDSEVSKAQTMKPYGDGMSTPWALLAEIDIRQQQKPACVQVV
eukprot:CAMPEP_0197656510 /NCGR_PEP_ID=MMETSP1338-20131121/42166_1 /TAXON_ID=43686 ORGANISM="Pelagodinium beii, Strain RCC1491" /NCGR_SAMPLE_ID=MMETSP1338 /ASSEMBLY_ACC=CAM_ASM_000754 /LENGTH=145 /DNA_ID=CAMNT_0043232537 /DNA_START=27 /DNA_END=461 /DNA_ORIENTATION=+